MPNQTSFDVVVHPAALSELTVLSDWLDFMSWPPAKIVAFVGEDPAIAEELTKICDSRGVNLDVLGVKSGKEFFHSESKSLFEQFEAVSADLALLIKLDTLPFRSARDNWLEEVLTVKEQTGALFISGGTQPYKADDPTSSQEFLKTKRVSNNFLMIAPQDWLRIHTARGTRENIEDRYATERNLEFHCAETEDFGIRCVNSPDWRVFHTQVWGNDVFALREKFRAGYRVQRFLKGYQDDLYHPWQAHYLHAAPNALKLARIKFGEFRQSLTR